MERPGAAVVINGDLQFGYHLAVEALKNYSGTLFITSENLARGKAAVRTFETEGIKPRFYHLNSSNHDRVNGLASMLKKNYGGIDLLINNGAVGYPHNRYKSLGTHAKATLNTNYFTVAKMCLALFPMLRPHSCIYTLKSDLARFYRLTNETIITMLQNSSLTTTQLSDLMNNFVVSAKRGDFNKTGWFPNSQGVANIGLHVLTEILERKLENDTRGIEIYPLHVVRNTDNSFELKMTNGTATETKEEKIARLAKEARQATGMLPGAQNDTTKGLKWAKLQKKLADRRARSRQIRLRGLKNKGKPKRRG